MIAIPVGIVWVGYLFTVYGLVTLHGKQVGLMDLVIPSRIDKVEALLRAADPIGSPGNGNGVGSSIPFTPGPTSTPANPTVPNSLAPNPAHIG